MKLTLVFLSFLLLAYNAKAAQSNTIEVLTETSNRKNISLNGKAFNHCVLFILVIN